MKHWSEIVEDIRKEHNGVFAVRLFLGHDGYNVCRFDTYDETLAEGQSGRSMQEAVERCRAAWEGAGPMSDYDKQISSVVIIRYTNYRGETANRRIVPIGIRFSSTKWHTEQQWLLEAFDLDRNAIRVFALKDVLEWGRAEGS